jgi:hypothetical protein
LPAFDNRSMHVLIPFASDCSDVAAHVLRDLRLPALARLLQCLAPTARDEADELTLSPPHERALASAWGWPPADGALPFAAVTAAADGIDVGTAAWGLLTPAHWIAGRDHVTMTDPHLLQLDEAESRALFESVRSLFESEGFNFAWGAPLRWYAAHPNLAGLPSASLDRVIGRNIDTWLPKTDAGRLLRRLQSEAQLTFYPHAVNEAREARGAFTVNTFWVSGCGVHRLVAGPEVDRLDALRGPLLNADWEAWAEAWRELDAGPISGLLQRCESGQDLTLTLCGERCAQTFATRSRSLWQRATSRWRSAPLHEQLASL